MKAREYLNLLIEENPTDEHSAALRELDQLLVDVAAYLPIGKQWAEGEALIKRLAQAGYGEK